MMDAKPSPVPHTGIPVRVADLQPFARSKCAYCNGSGERWVSKPLEIGKQIGKPMKSGRIIHKVKRCQVPCVCGLRDFLKVQRCAQDRQTGQLYFVEPVVAQSALSKAEQAKADAIAPTTMPDVTP